MISFQYLSIWDLLVRKLRSVELVNFANLVSTPRCWILLGYLVTTYYSKKVCCSFNCLRRYCILMTSARRIPTRNFWTLRETAGQSLHNLFSFKGSMCCKGMKYSTPLAFWKSKIGGTCSCALIVTERFGFGAQKSKLFRTTIIELLHQFQGWNFSKDVSLSSSW